MMLPINPQRQMVVDRSSYGEVKGAEAVDLETNQVAVREITYSGEARRTLYFAAGVTIVRRR